ncbi:unnamed protein product [Ixodes hexagonus]
MTPTRLLAAMVCSLGFLYQSQQVITWYFRYDFSVVPSEVIRSGIAFPATITYGVFKPQYEPELRLHGSYRPAELFHCKFLSSDPRCQPVDCVRSMKMTYFRPLMQQCYTMDPWEQTQFLNCPSPWNWGERRYLLSHITGKSNILDLDTILGLSNNFLPVVPPRRVCCVRLIIASMLKACINNDQRLVRLPSPYKSHCSDYAKRGVVPALQGYLNYDSCMQLCAMELERDQCGCVRPMHEFAGAVGWKNCLIQESDACFHLLNDSGIYESCSDKCGLPCEEVVYDVRVTGVSDLQGPNERPERFGICSRNRVGILVKFGSDVQQLIHYEPVFTSIEVLGYLSGYLGIWLGFCFATGALEAQSKLTSLCSEGQPSAW